MFFRRKSILLLGLSLVFSAQASTSECVQGHYQFSGDAFWLKPENKTMVYLIHNNDNKPVLINNISKSQGASAGYASEIQAGMWSALQLRKNIKYSCATHQGERIRYVACNQVLQICHYPLVQSPTEAAGDFWIAESKPREEVVLSVNHSKLKN